MVVYQDPWDTPPQSDPGSDTTAPAPSPSSPTQNNGPCPDGKIRNYKGECEDRCPDGYARNGAGECIELFPNTNAPDRNTGGCGHNQRWDEATGRCVSRNDSDDDFSPSSRPSPFNPRTQPYQFTPFTPPPKTPFEIDLQAQIDDFLKNWDKSIPYTDEVIRNQKTNAFRASFGRTNANKAGIEADAIERGVLRSTGTDRRLDLARNVADSAYSAATRDIDDTATQSNFKARTENRLAALDRAQRHLESEREYLLAAETNDFRRQDGLAKMAFAYYGLEQERWALTQSLNNSNFQFGKTMDWNKLLLEWQVANGIGA